VWGTAQRTTEQSGAFDPSGAGEQLAHEANAFAVHVRLPPRHRRDELRRALLSIVDRGSVSSRGAFVAGAIVVA